MQSKTRAGGDLLPWQRLAQLRHLPAAHELTSLPFKATLGLATTLGARYPALSRSSGCRQYGIFHPSTAGNPALITCNRSGSRLPTSPSVNSGRLTSARDLVVFRFRKLPVRDAFE
jgi:hypothetical protein